MGVIKKQGINNTIVTYFGILIGFVNIIFVQPHFLTTEEIGLVRILYSFSALVAMFLPMGIGSITLRYFPKFKNAEERHHGFLGVIILFVLVGCIIVSAILFLLKDFIIAQYIKESRLFTEYFYYVLPLSLFVAFNAVLTIYCQSLFKSTFPAFLNEVMIRLFSIIIISIYFLRFITLDQFILWSVLVYGIQVIILLVYIFKIDKPSLKIKRHYFKQHNISEMLRYGILLSVTAFASLGIKYIDTVMIAKYMPLAFAGIYSIAAFIPNIIEAPIGSLERISNAKIADELEKNRIGEVEKIYYQSTKYLMIVGGLLMLCVNTNIVYLFQLLPKDYSLGVNVVLILSVSTFFNMATGLNGSIIFNSKYYLYGSIMLFLLIALTIINNMILIPIYGLTGAAMATAFASLIYNLIKYLFIWIKMKMQPFDKSSLKIVLLIIGGFAFNLILPVFNQPILDMAVHTAVIGGGYLAFVYFLKIVPEFHHLIPFLGKRK